jgi:hypothetical protein
MPYYDLQETIDKFKAIAESFGVKVFENYKLPVHMTHHTNKSMSFQLRDPHNKKYYQGYISVYHSFFNDQRKETTNFDFGYSLGGLGLFLKDNSQEELENKFLDCFRAFQMDIPVKVHHVPKIEQLSLFEV